MLVSTAASPPALASVSADAYYTRKFDIASSALKTRPVYIGWNDQYTHAAAKARRAALTNAALVVTVANASTDFAAMPWILQANTQYYLHMYYSEDGVAKTHTRAFKTMSYPSTAAGIDSGLYAFDADLHIERKAREPVFYTAYNNEHTSTISPDYQGTLGGACGSPPGPRCSTSRADFMLFLFQNHGLGDAAFLEVGAFQFYDASITATPVSLYVWNYGPTVIAIYNVNTVTE